MSDPRPISTPRQWSDSSSGGLSVLSDSTSGPRTPAPNTPLGLPEPYYVQSPENSSGLPITHEHQYFETDSGGLPTHLKASTYQTARVDYRSSPERNAPSAKAASSQRPVYVEQVTPASVASANLSARYRTPPPSIQAARAPSGSRLVVPVNPDFDPDDPRNLEIDDPNASDSTESDQEPVLRTPVPRKQPENRTGSPESTRTRYTGQVRTPAPPSDNTNAAYDRTFGRQTAVETTFDRQAGLLASSPPIVRTIPEGQARVPAPPRDIARAGQGQTHAPAPPPPKVISTNEGHNRAPAPPPEIVQEVPGARTRVPAPPSEIGQAKSYGEARASVVPRATPDGEAIAHHLPGAVNEPYTKQVEQLPHSPEAVKGILQEPVRAPLNPAPDSSSMPKDAHYYALALELEPKPHDFAFPNRAVGKGTAPPPVPPRPTAEQLKRRGLGLRATPAPVTVTLPTSTPPPEPIPAWAPQVTPATPVAASEPPPAPTPPPPPPGRSDSEASIQKKLDTLLQDLSVPIVDAKKKDDNPVNGGAFADVWRGVMKPGDQTVALKILRLHLRGQDSHRLYRAIAREVSVWARLDNKNVLPFLGVRPQDDWESLWLVSPWMENGDIKTYLSANPNADRLSLASGVTSGVAYLHQNNIAHGDLKANNILVDSEGQPRLADFGLSLVLDDVLPEQTTSTMFAGSVRWMAPERIQPKRFGLEPSNSRTLPGDVFSLAMTLYEIFTLTLPYHELTQMDVPRAIVTGDRPPHPGPEAVQRGLHEDMWKFMQLCWSENPEHRPDLAKLSDDSDDQKSDSGETEEGDFRLSEIRSATVQTIERNIALDMPTNDPRPPVEASVDTKDVPISALPRKALLLESERSYHSAHAEEALAQEQPVQAVRAAKGEIEQILSGTSPRPYIEHLHLSSPDTTNSTSGDRTTTRNPLIPVLTGRDIVRTIDNTDPEITQKVTSQSSNASEVTPHPPLRQEPVLSHAEPQAQPNASSALALSAVRSEPANATSSKSLNSDWKRAPADDDAVPPNCATASPATVRRASVDNEIAEHRSDVHVDISFPPPTVPHQDTPMLPSKLKSRNPFRPRTVSQPSVQESSLPSGRQKDVVSDGAVPAMMATNNMASTDNSLFEDLSTFAPHPVVLQELRSKTASPPGAVPQASVPIEQPIPVRAPLAEPTVTVEDLMLVKGQPMATTQAKAPAVVTVVTPPPSVASDSSFGDGLKSLRRKTPPQTRASPPIIDQARASFLSRSIRTNSPEETVGSQQTTASQPTSLHPAYTQVRGPPATQNARRVEWDDVMTDVERTPTNIRRTADVRRDSGRQYASHAGRDDYLTDSELTPTTRRIAPLLPRVGRLAPVEELPTPPRRSSPAEHSTVLTQPSMHAATQSSQSSIYTAFNRTEPQMNFSTPSREKASAVNVHPELSFLADVQWQAPTDLKAMDMHQTTSQVGPRASTAISIQSPQQPGMTPQEPPAHTHGNIVQPTPQNYETSENKHNTIKLIELEDHLSASTHASDELSWGSQQSEDISDILITNLDKAISKDRLKRLFERFGDVLHVNIVLGDNGVSTGSVSFAHREDALRAVEQMDDETVGSKRICVSVL